MRRWLNAQKRIKKRESYNKPRASKRKRSTTTMRIRVHSTIGGAYNQLDIQESTAVSPRRSNMDQVATASDPSPRSTSLGRVSLSWRVALPCVRFLNPERRVLIMLPGVVRGSLVEATGSGAAVSSSFASTPSRSFSGSSMEEDLRFSSSEMSFVGGIVEMRRRDV